jgi:hypothetical protein
MKRESLSIGRSLREVGGEDELAGKMQKKVI